MAMSISEFGNLWEAVESAVSLKRAEFVHMGHNEATADALARSYFMHARTFVMRCYDEVVASVNNSGVTQFSPPLDRTTLN